MSLESWAYGSSKGVAVLVPRYASGTGDAADFTISTRPTKAHVEIFINQVSAILNAMLAENGFTIPISYTSSPGAHSAMVQFVEEECAAMTEGVNGSGRFGPTSKVAGRKGRHALMLDDVRAFIEGMAAGLERLGAPRSTTSSSGIASRGTDEDGNEIFPIFQREGFGNIFTDWAGS